MLVRSISFTLQQFHHQLSVFPMHQTPSANKSFCFLLSGIFSDLILIRIYLTFAYTFMILLAFFSGPPLDPGSLFWGFISLYVHGSSMIRLFHDETEVKLDDSKNREEESLWRFFYRRSGITRLVFKCHIAEYFEVVEAKFGEDLDTTKWFYIILDGAVSLDWNADQSVDEKTSQHSDDKVLAPLHSGACFDIRHLHPIYFSGQLSSAYRKGSSKHMQQRLRSESSPLESTINVHAKVISEQGCRLFRCSGENIKKLMKNGMVKDAMEGLLISTLSDMVEQKYNVLFQMSQPQNNNDEEDPPQEVAHGALATSMGERSDIFAPLEPEEEPLPYLAGAGSTTHHHTIRHLLYTIKTSFLLPWPLMKWRPGVRQIGSLPIPSHDNVEQEEHINKKEANKLGSVEKTSISDLREE